LSIVAPDISVGCSHARKESNLRPPGALAALGPSVCYSFFGAVGIAAVAILGVVFARDSIRSLRIVSLALIVLGVAGVALTSGIGSTSGTR
jgi:hypothetical protein